MGCCLSSSMDHSAEEETQAIEAYQKYRESKNPVYLKDSINMYTRIVQSRRAHDHLATTIMTLADRRWELCERSGKRKGDIQEVIELYEEAKHLWDWKQLDIDGDVQQKEHYAVLLVSLGNTYRELYEQMEDTLNDGAIQKAIACYQEARNFKNECHPKYYEATLMLGLCLWSRCSLQGHDRRLKGAIGYLGEAYEYFDGKPMAATCVYNLANAYFTLSGKHGSTLEDLNFAIEYYQTAIDLLGNQHIKGGLALYNLSQALIRRYNARYELSDLKEAAKNARLARQYLPKEKCPRVEEILAFTEYVLNPAVNSVNKKNGKVRVGLDIEGLKNPSKAPAQGSIKSQYSANTRRTASSKSSTSTNNAAAKPWMFPVSGSSYSSFPPLPEIPTISGKNSPTPTLRYPSAAARKPARSKTRGDRVERVASPDSLARSGFDAVVPKASFSSIPRSHSNNSSLDQEHIPLLSIPQQVVPSMSDGSGGSTTMNSISSTHSKATLPELTDDLSRIYSVNIPSSPEKQKLPSNVPSESLIYKEPPAHIRTENRTRIRLPESPRGARLPPQRRQGTISPDPPPSLSASNVKATMSLESSKIETDNAPAIEDSGLRAENRTKTSQTNLRNDMQAASTSGNASPASGSVSINIVSPTTTSESGPRIQYPQPPQVSAPVILPLSLEPEWAAGIDSDPFRSEPIMNTLGFMSTLSMNGYDRNRYPKLVTSSLNGNGMGRGKEREGNYKSFTQNRDTSPTPELSADFKRGRSTNRGYMNEIGKEGLPGVTTTNNIPPI